MEEDIKFNEKLQRRLIEQEVKRRENLSGRPSILSNNNDEKSEILSKNSETKKIVKQDQESNNNLDRETDNVDESTPLFLRYRVVRKFLNIFDSINRKDKNNSLSSKNASIDLLTGLKKIFEELIVFLIFISAVSKVNIVSFLYIINVLIIQVRGRNMKSIYYSTVFVSLMIFTQTLLFLSNLNIYTDPRRNVEMHEILTEELGFPWYLKFMTDAWGFFFSMGVIFYQIKTLWVEFIILIISFIYLDNFAFSYLEDTRNKLNISKIKAKPSVKKGFKHMNREEFEKKSKALKDNFDIEIHYDDFLEKDELNLKSMNTKFFEEVDLKEKIANKTKRTNTLEKIIETIKESIYLGIHNFILVFTLLLSMLNPGVISLFYISFSVIFLYQGRRIMLVEPYYYPKAILKLIRPILVLDLLLQILFQNPYNTYIKKDSIAILIFDLIGINKAIDFDGDFEIISKVMLLLDLKTVTYFLISLQIIIYSSNDFKEFYITYIFKKHRILKKNSIISSFLFNNERIKSMKTVMENRKQIDTVLNELEDQLQKWDRRLSHLEGIASSEKKEIITKEIKESLDEPPTLSAEEIEKAKTIEEIKNEEDLIKNEIKQYLLSNFMANFYIFIHKITISYRLMNEIEKQEFEVEILRGETYTKSRIEKQIDKFLMRLELNVDQLKEFLVVIKHKEKALKKVKQGDINNQNKNKVDKEEKIDFEEKEKEKERENDEIRLIKNEEEKEKVRIKENALTVSEAENKIEEENKTKKKKIDPLKGINVENYIHFFDQKLFKEVLTTSSIIKRSFYNMIFYFFDNFQYPCFIFMLINHMMNHSLISMFWPIILFGYALLEYPRPSKTFWKIANFYCLITLIFKFVLQTRLWNIIFDHKVDKKYDINFVDKYRIGIERFEDLYSVGFLNYIIWDCILILCIMMQQYVLIARGIWHKTEIDVEGLEKAYERIYRARSIPNKDIQLYSKLLFKEIMLEGGSKNLKKSFNEFRNENSIGSKSENYGEEKASLKSKIKDYYSRIFTTIRNEKPGRDLYASYLTVMMFIIVYIILAYTKMDRNNLIQMSDATNGAMVVMCFLHVFIVVLDRIIYLNQSRQNLKFHYIYFHRPSGRKYTKEEINSLGLSKDELQDYEEIYIQKETPNYPLLLKYLLHVIIIIFSHSLIFYFFPMIGTKNLQNTYYCINEDKSQCNDFGNNVYLIIFYILYVLYLYFSALQIRFGLMDMRQKSLFMRGDNIIYYSVFKTYQSIPFFYELKLTIDWTCTATSLDLFKWLKFEAVYDLLFVTHCKMKSVENTSVGKRVGIFYKLSMGITSFLVLMIIILGPLIIFSDLNPTNENNNVTGAEMELSISFDKEGVFNNYTLFKNQYVESIKPMDQETFRGYNYSQSTQTMNFPLSQIQVLTMSNISDTIWDIAEPHVKSIIKRLDNIESSEYQVYFQFRYRFIRPFPAEARNSEKKFDYKIYYDYKNGTVIYNKDLVQKFLTSLKTCEKQDIYLKEFYNPAMRLSSEPHPKVIWDKESWKNLGVVINLSCYKFGDEIDYTSSYYTLSKVDDPYDQNEGLVFHTFSDKVSKTSATYDVLTFYISFILVIGRLIRTFISGEAEKIVFTEMPEPKHLMNLCEGIKISRYRWMFEREEYLYYVLIDFMRSPEILKMLTKSSLQKLRERKDRNG